ncbi:MAG: hypothetical protein EOM92_12680 [Gammaproteobacteria bacterium]|nr:hypothetical protein [Gammaproteobacteria bacterium]
MATRRAGTLAAAREADARLEGECVWKRALDGAGHGFWDWYLDTDRLDLSPTWKSMLGYEAADIGNHLGEWQRLVHPEDLPQAMAAVEAHLAGETPRYECLTRMRCKDRTWKWVLDLRPIRCPDPQRVAGGIGVIHGQLRLSNTKWDLGKEPNRPLTRPFSSRFGSV